MVVTTTTGAASRLKGYEGTFQEVIDAMETEFADAGSQRFLLFAGHNGTNYFAIVRNV